MAAGRPAPQKGIQVRSNAADKATVYRANVRDARSQIETALRQMPEFARIANNVKMSVTG